MYAVPGKLVESLGITPCKRANENVVNLFCPSSRILFPSGSKGFLPIAPSALNSMSSLKTSTVIG